MENLLNMPLELMIALGANLLFIVLLFLMTLGNRIKIKRLKSKYTKFMSSPDGLNMEQLLENCLNKLKEVSDENKEIKSHLNNLDRTLMNCIQKVGVVRFNAFDNVGSDLSFSIALLNENDEGVVISGLYSRESSSTYAKPITGGKSRYPLSAEEIKAIDIARKTSR